MSKSVHGVASIIYIAVIGLRNKMTNGSQTFRLSITSCRVSLCK